MDAIIADLLNNLAACYEVMGDVASAMNFYQESLKLRPVHREMKGTSSSVCKNGGSSIGSEWKWWC